MSLYTIGFAAVSEGGSVQVVSGGVAHLNKLTFKTIRNHFPHAQSRSVHGPYLCKKELLEVDEQQRSYAYCFDRDGRWQCAHVSPGAAAYEYHYNLMKILRILSKCWGHGRAAHAIFSVAVGSLRLLLRVVPALSTPLKLLRYPYSVENIQATIFSSHTTVPHPQMYCV